MLVEMDKRMLASLIKGCDPAYEIMEHPLIKSKGSYSGGHYDRWNWNNSFGDCTEEQLWETYQLLKNPVPYKAKPNPYSGGLCTVDSLYARLGEIEGVVGVKVEDHYNFSVSITVVGGKDEDIANVLAHSLPATCLTKGDYRVSVSLDGLVAAYNIYRSFR